MQKHYLADIIEPVAENMGFDVVRILTIGDSNPTVQVMIGHKDYNQELTVDDCAEVSRALSALLDEKDPISDKYTLEVSSPGLDRPLKKPADFVRHMGEKIDVGLYKAIDGDKTITGTLTDYDDGGLTLETADGPVKLEKGEIAVVKQHLDF